jgi:LysM repeat protein
MDNNDSNLKSPQTGGLKLMTVFIAVLALHVVVIGGFTVYHLMSGGSGDTDLVTDKNHKNVKIAADGTDVSVPDGGNADKTASASTTTAPAVVTPAPAADAVTAPDATVSTPAPDATTTTVSAAPVTPTPAPDVTTASTPSGPVINPPAGQGPAPATADAEAPAEPNLEPETGGISYKVKSHDSLARIAHHYHITLAKLRAANDLKSDRLKIGQKLIIPAKSELATSAPAASGPDTTLLGDSPSMPAAKSVASSTHDKSMMMASGGGHHTYTVVKGDTLTRIAHKFHTSTSAIMALNGAIDARKLRIGQKLRIPSQESRSANIAPAPVAQPVQPDTERIEPRATPSAELANFMP